MLVIVGLIVLLVAAIVATVGVLSNAGAAHPLTDFSVFGYHPTGSTGTLFLFGIAVGAVASLGLCVLLAGAWRAATSGGDTRLVHQDRAGGAAEPLAPPDEGTTRRRRLPSLGRWLSGEYSLTGRAEVPPPSRHVIAMGSDDASRSTPD
jgi:hypothetical protein